MTLRKTTALNLRMTPEMKTLLRLAAEREHRTLSNMIESLVLGYCQTHGITKELPSAQRPATKTTTAKVKARSA